MIDQNKTKASNVKQKRPMPITRRLDEVHWVAADLTTYSGKTGTVRESMQDGKSAAREKELLAAADVAGMIGVKETTVYRWCKEGKLPCLKIGKHWRIRREALEDFLRQSERPRTLAGQLDSFLRVPDSV